MSSGGFVIKSKEEMLLAAIIGLCTLLNYLLERELEMLNPKPKTAPVPQVLSLIHISEPTRPY